jgi:surface antigen
MSIEAMKQALDALEEHGTHYARHEDDYIKAITALRQAIAEAEKQEPVAWHEPGAYGNVTTHKDWALANGWKPLYKEKNNGNTN